VEDIKPRGKIKITWKEVIDKDLRNLHFGKEDGGSVCSELRKLIKTAGVDSE